MTDSPAAATSDGVGELPHLTIDDVEYSWRIDASGIAVLNSNGATLDPVAARVIVALGGTEPSWYAVANALTAAHLGAPDEGGGGVVSAAKALSRSSQNRARLARTTSDRAVLYALAAFGEVAVGRNAICDFGAWDLVINHRDPAIRLKALSANEVLPEALCTHPDLETRVRVARNPDCSAGVLSSLATGVPRLRTTVATNVSCPAALLERLSQDDEWQVRQAVAANPHCPSKRVFGLLRDRIAEVRVAMVTNPSVDVRTVRLRIDVDPTPAVHAAMATRVELRDRDLSLLERRSRGDAVHQYNLVCKRILSHPSCGASLAHRIAVNQERVAALPTGRPLRRKSPLGEVSWRRIRTLTIILSCITLVGTLAAVGMAELTQGQTENGEILWVLAAISAAGSVLIIRRWVRMSGYSYRTYPPRPQGLLRMVVICVGVSAAVSAPHLQSVRSSRGVGEVLLAILLVSAVVAAIFLLRRQRRKARDGD